MYRFLVLVLVAALAACNTEETGSTMGDDTSAFSNQSSTEVTSANNFVARTWILDDSTAGAPGTIRVFLPDGSLLMDSCFETYRIARWRATDRNHLVLTEDTRETPVEITRQDSLALHLRLSTPGGPREERYRPVSGEYVCPDMPK